MRMRRRRRLRRLEQGQEHADRLLVKAEAEIKQSKSDEKKVEEISKLSEWLSKRNSISNLIKTEIIGGHH